MKIARSVIGGILGLLLFLALSAATCVIIDERCSRNVSADDTGGMAISQDVPYAKEKGKK